MSIHRAEELKRDWTDKYVSVQNGVAELRRFEGLVGQVKTVNMNCRLLVQFDTPADISWYDIDPAYLQAVDPSNVPQKTSAATDQSGSAAKENGQSAAKAKQAAAPTTSGAGGSPLDQIRQQSATPAKSATPEQTATKPAANTLDAIRQQSSGTAAAATKPATNPATGTSPLDAIRKQNAGDSPTTSAEVSAKVAGSTGASPLDQIRKQASADSETPSPKTDSPLDQIRSQSTTSPPADSDSSNATVESRPQPEAETTDTDSNQASASHAIAQPPAKSAAEILRPTAPLSVPKSTADSPLDQIRTQAGMDSESSTSTVFDQVRAQAAAHSDPSESTGQTRATDASRTSTDKASLAPAASLLSTSATSTVDGAGGEDPVKQTYRGKKLPKQDDLKIVEGIGPKIEELFHAADINTWQSLATADPERLSQILKDAGPRFQMHNPETWPNQARLAAEGKWQELEQYQDLLDGGRATPAG